MPSSRVDALTDSPGAPLVIAHGLLGQGRNFGTLARGFAEKRAVICVDMRNHGDSPLASLVVADIAPIAYDHEYHKEIEAMRQIGLEGISRRKQADQILLATIPQAAMRAFLLQNLSVSGRPNAVRQRGGQHLCPGKPRADDPDSIPSSRIRQHYWCGALAAR